MAEIFGIEIPFVPQAFLDRIIAVVEQFFAPIIKPIKGALNLFFNFKEITVGTLNEFTATANDAVAAYQGLRQFSVNFDKDARHRVVETVRAYQQIRRLAIDIPVDIWEHVKSFIANAQAAFKPAGVAAEEAAAEIKELEGVTELKDVLSKIGPKAGKIVGKAFEILAIVQTILQMLHDQAVNLHSIVADLKEEIEKINRLNFIFLPQDNRRQRLKLEDGSTYYRRIPKSGPSNA